MAFSEGEFNSTLKQFSATPNCNIEGDLTKKVDAWLNQDYINSMQEAELDAGCQTLKNIAKSFNAMLKQEPHGKIPVALEVRFVAANAYLSSSKSMKQHAQGEQLLKELLNDQQFSDTDIAFRGSVWMSAAALALEQQKREEAIVFLNEVIENNAPQSDNARVMIRNLS
ncbi:hypothetical protein BH11PSE12_BH11PSE12_03260 [soil metagenome]